jgi:flagellar hook-associated protein 3
VRELAIQGDNSTNTALQRSYIGNEVRQVLLQMVGISNTTYKGDFVFSGKNTDIPPFQVMKGSESVDNVNNTGVDVTDTFLTVAELNTPLSIFDRNSNDSSTPSGNPIVEKIIPGTLEIQGLDEGTDYKVDYVNGTITYLTNNAVTQAAGGGIDLNFDWIRRAEEDLSGDILRQIDDSVVAKVNVTADDVFGSNTETDTFEAIIKLLQGLHANEQNNISDSISEIDEVLERTLSAVAVIGSRANQMDGSIDRIGEKVIETTRLQSNIEDLDFAKAISDFTLHEAVYNASLQSAARVLQPTLSDFI